MERLGGFQTRLLSDHEPLPVHPDDEWEAKVGLMFEQLDASENTRRQYKREIRPFLRFLRERGRHLTPTLLLEWKRQLEKRTDIGSGSKKKLLNVARVLLRELHRWHPHRIPDLTKGVRSFQVTRVHKRSPLTDEDIRQVWDYLEAEGDLRTKTIIGLLYYQGLRRIEVTRLKAEDFHAGSKTLFVHGKGGDDKEPCDLHPRMMEILTQYLESQNIRSGPLFPSRRRKGKGLSSNMIWRIVKGVHRQVGISKNVHAYRKAFTSKLIDSGLNILEVRQYTRHRDVSQL